MKQLVSRQGVDGAFCLVASIVHRGPLAFGSAHWGTTLTLDLVSLPPAVLLPFGCTRPPLASPQCPAASPRPSPSRTPSTAWSATSRTTPLATGRPLPPPPQTPIRRKHTHKHPQTPHPDTRIDPRNPIVPVHPVGNGTWHT